MVPWVIGPAYICAYGESIGPNPKFERTVKNAYINEKIPIYLSMNSEFI